MNTTELLSTGLIKRREELQTQRQAFILQAERQIAFFEGQIAEIDALLKRLAEPTQES